MNNDIQKLIQGKNINQAKEKLKEIIKNDPKNTQAMHLLGTINAQTGNNNEGIKLLQRAIALEPKKAMYLCDLATMMQQIGYKNEAIEYYQKAIKIDANLFQAYYNLGNIYAEQNKNKESIEAYEKAIETNPKFAPAYNNLGNVLKAEKNIAEALYMYQHAVLTDPNYALAYNNIGLILQSQGKDEEAIQLFQKTLAINPNYLEVNINLANAYKSKRLYKEAIELYKKVINKNPKYVYAYNNLGLTYQELGEDKEALSYYKKALEIDPNFADVYSNMGSLYQKLGNFTEALKYYEQAIKKRPDYSQAKFNIGTIHFLKGEYEQAWRYHEARLNFPDAIEREQKYFKIRKVPKWQGENLEGKTIFVYSEQGYGDTIQFVRYLPLLKQQKGAEKILFKTQPMLEKLFKTNDLKTEILSSYIEKDKFVYDVYISLLSLPYYFQTTTQNIPKREGYLKAEQEKIQEYKNKFFKTDKLKIGIAWQGFKNHISDLQRSIPLKEFLPIFQKDIKIYSLQKGHGEDHLLGLPDIYEVTNLGKTFNDFSDTAAALTNLDLVITVDTSVAHLAAALGKKTWILIPPIPDWRWGLESDKSVWYKSVKLFRKNKDNTWSNLFKEISQELSFLN